jgi:hypothetical protein
LKKQEIITDLARQYQLKVLVETGTFLGDMVRAMRDRFREIYTIELSDELYERAKRKFDGQPHIHCLNGDSPSLLTSILRRMGEPCLFWLDGHYSGPGTAGSHRPCPVMEELTSIAAHTVKSHVILIDDARLFNASGGYPTVAEIASFATVHFPRHALSVEDDILRLCPPPI